MISRPGFRSGCWDNRCRLARDFRICRPLVPGGQAVQALPIYVALYQPGEENPYTILPNIFCLRIDYREGPEPPLARFQYMMGDLLQAAAGWPSQFEQLWPIDAQGDYVVMTDDRLVVLTQIPSGTADGNPQTVVLFDGFAQVPQADVSAGSQAVTFVAQGVAIRLWDSPITGRKQRDASRRRRRTGRRTSSSSCRAGSIRRTTRSGPRAAISATRCRAAISPRARTSTITRSSSSRSSASEAHFGVDTSYWFVSDVIAYLIATEPSPEDDAGLPYVLYPTD